MRVLLVGLALLLCARVARADGIDDRIEELETSDDSKRRITALAALTKAGDPRAIPALIEALHTDEDKNVRGAAAVALGKLVTSSTPAELRKQAMDALKAATSKKREPESFVRKQAKKAYAKLDDLGASAAGVSPGTVYVDLGPMASRIHSTNPSVVDLTAAMDRSLAKVVRRDANDWLTQLPAGADLTQLVAYAVDGAVEEVVTKQASSGASLRCKVTMRIATYPQKNPLAYLSGSAAVELHSISDIEAATYDCTDAVIESLVVKKIIPAIKSGSFSSSSSSSGGTSNAAWSKPAAAAAPARTSETDEAAWSPDGWTLLGEDDVDLIEDEVEVDRSKSTWSEVAIVVTGDAVKVNTVELSLAGKGHKLQQAEIAQTFTADSAPRVIEVTGSRRTIDKVRLTYKKHTLDGRTRVQVWAR